jgi:hypothetical protein
MKKKQKSFKETPDEKNGCKRNAQKACRGQSHLIVKMSGIHEVAKDESPDTYMHGNFETEKFWEWCEVRQFARASFLSRLHTGIGVNRGIANETSRQIKTT